MLTARMDFGRAAPVYLVVCFVDYVIGLYRDLIFFFFSSRRRHTRSVSAFLLNRSSDLFKLAPSVCRMTFPILASLLVRLVVLLPFQLLRLSLATPSRWTPLALSVFLHCVVALLLTLL